MSALKSRSHPEAPARLALSFILLLIDCLCVSDGLACLCFLSSWHVRSLRLWFSIVFSLLAHFHSLRSLAGFKGTCVTYHSITFLLLDSYTLPSLYPLGNLDEKRFFWVFIYFLLCRPSNKAKGEIIPEAVRALGGWNEFRTTTEAPCTELVYCMRSGGIVETEYQPSLYLWCALSGRDVGMQKKKKKSCSSASTSYTLLFHLPTTLFSSSLLPSS